MIGRLHRISRRERRLAILAGIFLGLSLAYALLVHALESLAAMDAEIERLEEDLVHYTAQMQRLDEVEEAFQGVAAEHSSEWTQEEIHDRLRREIIRLSLLNAPPPGTAVEVSTGGPRLVSILQMPLGTLTRSEHGYREYAITFQTRPSTIRNIAQFLARLHKSPQVLRVEALELTRAHYSTAVTARITVVRIVIDV